MRWVWKRSAGLGTGGSEGGTHGGQWGGATGPDFPGEGALVEEHGAAVGGAGAGFLGGAEESGAGGFVDGVVNAEVGLEDAGGEDGGIGGAQAGGGAVDDEVDGVKLAGEGSFVKGQGFEADIGTLEFGGVEAGGEALGKGLGFFGGAIGDDEAFAAFEGALVGDGLADAAGAEDEDAEVADVEAEVLTDGADPAGAIGAEADEAAGVVEHGVDRAGGGGSGVAFVHQIFHGGLMGDGAVPAGEGFGAEGADHVGELVGGDFEAAVLGGECGVFEGGELDGGGEGVGDGVAEDAVERGLGGEGIKIGGFEDIGHADKMEQKKRFAATECGWFWK